MTTPQWSDSKIMALIHNGKVVYTTKESGDQIFWRKMRPRQPHMDIEQTFYYDHYRKVVKAKENYNGNI